jgi:negative regulator of flagellin synthesis FlgM
MNNVESATRSKFFPRQKNENQIEKANQLNLPPIDRNNPGRRNELEEVTREDVKVKIPDAIRDFSKIKKAVDRAPDIDNSEKLARLKEMIDAGTYQIDYDAIADRLISSDL